MPLEGCMIIFLNCTTLPRLSIDVFLRMCVMNTQLLEALCKDFAVIYQCGLIQDTIDIVRFDKGTHTDKLWIPIHLTPFIK